MREEILETIRSLAPFPLQGHTRADLTSSPLRFQAIRDYLIVYAADEKPILVIAVLHVSAIHALLRKSLAKENNAPVNSNLVRAAAVAS